MRYIWSCLHFQEKYFEIKNGALAEHFYLKPVILAAQPIELLHFKPCVQLCPPPPVLPRAISNRTFPSICVWIQTEFIGPKSSRSRTTKHQTQRLASFPTSYFYITGLVLSQICSKLFHLWGEWTEKWELLPQKEKKTQQQIFQGTMATEHSNFLSLMRTAGEADYKGDNLLLLFVTPLAGVSETDCTLSLTRTHTRVTFFTQTTLKNAFSFILSWPFSQMTCDSD